MSNVGCSERGDEKRVREEIGFFGHVVGVCKSLSREESHFFFKEEKTNQGFWVGKESSFAGDGLALRVYNFYIC